MTTCGGSWAKQTHRRSVADTNKLGWDDSQKETALDRLLRAKSAFYYHCHQGSNSLRSRGFRNRNLPPLARATEGGWRLLLINDGVRIPIRNLIPAERPNTSLSCLNLSRSIMKTVKVLFRAIAFQTSCCQRLSNMSRLKRPVNEPCRALCSSRAVPRNNSRSIRSFPEFMFRLRSMVRRFSSPVLTGQRLSCAGSGECHWSWAAFSAEATVSIASGGIRSMKSALPRGSIVRRWRSLGEREMAGAISSPRMISSV